MVAIDNTIKSEWSLLTTQLKVNGRYCQYNEMWLNLCSGGGSGVHAQRFGWVYDVRERGRDTGPEGDRADREGPPRPGIRRSFQINDNQTRRQRIRLKSTRTMYYYY
jgi:hypothetical protein